MLHHGVLLAALSAVAAVTAEAADTDSAAFVQSAVKRSGQEQPPSEGIFEVPQGPKARTSLGNYLGVYEDTYAVFKGIKYQKAPGRFEKGTRIIENWDPELVEATAFGPGCIGSKNLLPESEDCFNLNIWVPKAGGTGMPVIVYFHGGLNQLGSGSDPLRQGDIIVQSQSYPAIFINFDFRLGIFGWISGSKQSAPKAKQTTAFPRNLGFHDQLMALRWVQQHIGAFGGDRDRVTLQGVSEGCSAVLAHMVSPYSRDLFQRAILHSPSADIWQRNSNTLHTNLMIDRVGCARSSDAETFECLLNVPAQKLWAADWVAQDYARSRGSPMWFTSLIAGLQFRSERERGQPWGAVGWHVQVDGDLVPKEPRELISQGKWNKVPVLITIAKNESMGVFPGGPLANGVIDTAFDYLFDEFDAERVKRAYLKTLEDSGIQGTSEFSLQHQVLTDKMWTCEARSLARDIMMGGGTAFVEVFWKEPKYDPVGALANGECQHGATCHGADMFYALPQGRYVGIHGLGMQQEVSFARKYMDHILGFAHGDARLWEAYDIFETPITLYKENGPEVKAGYRKEQCKVLDGSVNRLMPDFMKRIIGLPKTKPGGAKAPVAKAPVANEPISFGAHAMKKPVAK